MDGTAMKCIKCGKENLPEALHCMHCGAKLDEVVLKLEDIDARLRSLILNIPPQKNTMNERYSCRENRLVTALFIDISNFTLISAKRSPEETFQLIDERFTNRLAKIIENYEGNIGGFQGDCLFILFGGPTLYENDIERAIMAAIEMRQAMQEQQIEVTIGINTDRVTAGELQTQYTAYGPGINLAKRLQESAQPGQILVGENSYRLAQRMFDFEVIPSLRLKHFPQPVTAYAVKQMKPHPEKLRGIEGLQTEFIGREKEIAELKECVDKWLAGKGQVTAIIGEAGIGKSRLVEEMRNRLEAQDLEQKIENESEVPIPKPYVCLEGRCLSIGKSISYAVFINMLRNYLEHSEEHSQKNLGEKLLDKIKELFPQRWDKIIPYIGNLLSVKFGNEWDEKVEKVKYSTPEQMEYHSSLISRILRDLFLALANQKPLLLIFDDLHWADDLSQKLLLSLMDDAIHAPLMLLCVSRPENDQWRIEAQTSGKIKGIYKEIMLRELLPRESQQLLESLMIENLPKETKESILSQAEGNPFFIEEFIRSLIDRGFIIRQDNEKWIAQSEIGIITVPDTIQGVIMSRIDTLESPIRQVLKFASVIGKFFQLRLLQYTTQEPNLDKYLQQLQEKELIYIYGKYDTSDLEFSFKHVLIQETLYESLTMQDQRILHRSVGEGIEDLYQHRIKEFYEELASHYLQGEVISKAIYYLLRSGEKAKGMYAYQKAISYFDNALELVQKQLEKEREPSMEIALWEALGEVLFTIGYHHEAEIHLRQALDIASKRAGSQYLASLTYKLADAIHLRDYDEAIEMAEPALLMLDEQPNCPERLNLLELISRSYWAKYDYGSAHRYTDQIVRTIHKVPYFDTIYKSYYAIAWVETCLGNFQEADGWLEEMEQVCLTNDNELGLARCYHGMADYWRARDDLIKASQWYKESLRYCERTGEAHFLLEGHLELAEILLRLDGDLDEVDFHIKQGMKIVDDMAGDSSLPSVQSFCGILGEKGNYYWEKGNIKSAVFCFRYMIEFALNDVIALYFCLRNLENLCMKQGKHDMFIDLCRQIQKQSKYQQTSLRYWHLQDGSLCSDYDQLIFWDPFKGPSLHEDWQWNDPDGKSTYNFIQNGGLELRTCNGHDLAQDISNAPRLIRQISGDFAVQTTLVGLTEDRYQVGGLLIWASESAYLIFGKRNPQIEAFLDVCLDGHHKYIGRGFLPGSENQVHLRLERREELVKAFCSNDAKHWFCFDDISFPVNDLIWIGVYIACPSLSGSSDSVLCFQEFKVYI